MNCQTCFGRGARVVAVYFESGVQIGFDEAVCPECHGSGTTHCCEGDREEPDDEPR
jgi:DnaJ-class molecular chaperone